jgi:hypothetical protein
MQQIPSLFTARNSDSHPKGYVCLKVDGRYAVAREWAAPALRELLADTSLYEWAAAQTDKDLMYGRGASYGVVLPAGSGSSAATAVVVRRNRHGGLLRHITGEYFSLPTRAPLELANALRLSASGVNTPELIAYALYPAIMHLVRCDVITRRLPDGADFPDAWRRSDSSDREFLLHGLAALLRALAAAGACHADLNLKNIYIAGSGSAVTPYVLDVDRVTFPSSGDIAARNFCRLARSARKWHTKRGLDFDEKTLERLAALA